MAGHRAICFCYWLGCALLLAGCGPAGPKTYEVSGTASFNGEPIANGDVLFVAADSTLAPAGARIVDGAFRLRVPAGKNKVEIRAAREVGRAKMGPIYKDFIPPRFNSQSELMVDIPTSDGKNELDFPLQDSGKPTRAEPPPPKPDGK